MDSSYVSTSLATSIRLSDIKAAFQALLIIRSFNYAMLTLLLWDMVLTLRAEVAVVWSARLSVVKVLFLANRYLTPAFVGLHLWTFSGYATGLNNTACRVIYSIATVAEVLSISTVSLVMILRLYALYRLSSRTFYGFIILWFLTLLAVGMLLIFNFWLNLNQLVYMPSVNICLTTVHATAWTQWIPRVIEHGTFCLFLIFNAMSTPRPGQTMVLALIYREGIVYYAFTFSVLLASILICRFAGPLYIGLAIYSTSLFLTMATSRLLLSIKSSDSMRNDGPSGNSDSSIPGHHRPSPSFEIIARYSHKKSCSVTDTLTHHRHIGDTSIPITPISIDLDFGTSASDGRTVRQHTTLLKKKAWWLFGAAYEKAVVETWVEIEQKPDLEEVAPQVNGLHVSRLGRYDHWL